MVRTKVGETRARDDKYGLQLIDRQVDSGCMIEEKGEKSVSYTHLTLPTIYSV